MAIYVAMEPPGAEAEDIVFVRDGFAFLAFFVPALWLLWHRMWIEAGLALTVTLALGSLDAVSGVGGPLASFLVSLLIGLEAPALLLWSLRRRGWRERGVAEGETVTEAETRFFLEGGSAAEASSPAAYPAPFGRSERRNGPALGFLDRRSFV